MRCQLDAPGDSRPSGLPPRSDAAATMAGKRRHPGLRGSTGTRLARSPERPPRTRPGFRWRFHAPPGQALGARSGTPVFSLPRVPRQASATPETPETRGPVRPQKPRRVPRPGPAPAPAPALLIAQRPMPPVRRPVERHPCVPESADGHGRDRDRRDPGPTRSRRVRAARPLSPPEWRRSAAS